MDSYSISAIILQSSWRKITASLETMALISEAPSCTSKRAHHFQFLATKCEDKMFVLMRYILTVFGQNATENTSLVDICHQMLHLLCASLFSTPTPPK